MKKNYILTGGFLAATLLLINTVNVNSKQLAPPAGSNGDPNGSNATCAQSGCHAAPVSTASSSDVTFTIGTGQPTTPLTSAFTYQPNTTYNIGFVINAAPTGSGNTNYYGFQLSALDASNAKAGTFAVTTSTNTSLDNTAGFQWIGHKGANSNKTWVFKWTSPAASSGPVTFYYSFVAAKSAQPASNPEGTVYKNTVTIQEGAGSGINNLDGIASGLTVFPNPINNQFGLSFDAIETADFRAEVYNLNGAVVANLFEETVSAGKFNRTFNINDLSAGVYMVKLSSGQGSVTQKIFKQ